jgi:cell division topological specificity factor
MSINILSRLFGNKKSSAAIAKERLQIILAHEGNRDLSTNRGLNLQSLQAEIILVIAKHLHIGQDRVKVHLRERDNQHSVFELNVDLSDSA